VQDTERFQMGGLKRGKVGCIVGLVGSGRLSKNTGKIKNGEIEHGPYSRTVARKMEREKAIAAGNPLDTSEPSDERA